MGRSGGGGGGGGRSSGGHSSGGRSSGSFSGGHSSTSFGGRSRRMSSSSFSGGRSRSRSHHNTSSYSGRGYGSPTIFTNTTYIGNNQPIQLNNNKQSSKYFGLIASLVMFIIACFICIPMAVGSFTSITETSEVVREPLPTSYANGTPYYTDEDGDWIYNESKLNPGMREFYDNTGVWPYVYILPNGYTTNADKLQKTAEELYSELFNDEAHFLMVFCDDNTGGYNWGYCVGADAKTIMDDDALVTMNNFLERNYDNLNLSEEEIFSKTFASTSQRIMGIGSGNGFSDIIFLVISIVTISAFGLFVIRQLFLIRKVNKEEEQEEKDKRLEEILSTPLEKFEDNELDDLAEKYEKENESLNKDNLKIKSTINEEEIKIEEVKEKEQSLKINKIIE